MRSIKLLMIASLTGCASSEQSPYDLVIPKADSEVIEYQLNERSRGSFTIHYKKDRNDNPITKTINRSTTVIGNDSESLKSLRERAKKEIVQLATEEVNGVVISSSSEIDTVAISVDSNSNTLYSRQDFTEKAVSQTAGIARIKDLQCQTLATQGSSLLVKCNADVTVQLIESIDIKQE